LSISNVTLQQATKGIEDLQFLLSSGGRAQLQEPLSGIGKELEVEFIWHRLRFFHRKRQANKESGQIGNNWLIEIEVDGCAIVNNSPQRQVGSASDRKAQKAIAAQGIERWGS